MSTIQRLRWEMQPSNLECVACVEETSAQSYSQYYDDLNWNWNIDWICNQWTTWKSSKMLQGNKDTGWIPAELKWKKRVGDNGSVSSNSFFFYLRMKSSLKLCYKLLFFFHLTCYDQSSVWFMWRILLWDWFAAVVHIMETSAVVITFCNSVKRMKWSITLKNKQECRMCLYSTF